MSCMWCNHFYRELTDADRRKNGISYLSLPGQCMLNPVPVEVSGNHYCAKFQIKPSDFSEGRTVIAELWLLSSRERNKEQELRAEVKRLKVSNRKLRDAVKALKK